MRSVSPSVSPSYTQRDPGTNGRYGLSIVVDEVRGIELRRVVAAVAGIDHGLDGLCRGCLGGLGGCARFGRPGGSQGSLLSAGSSGSVVPVAPATAPVVASITAAARDHPTGVDCSEHERPPWFRACGKHSCVFLNDR